MQPLKLSIVIPVFRSPVLKECVSALSKTLGDSPVEIIIVENGKDPETLRNLAELQLPNIRILHSPERSAASARNLGAQLASGAWILFIDADVIVPEDFGARISEHLEQTFFSCLVFSIEPVPHPKDSPWVTRYRRLLRTSETLDTFVWSRREMDWSSSIFVINSACFAIRKSVFHSVGDFRRDLRRCEDVEFSQRFAHARENIRILGDCRVSVIFGGTLFQYLAKFFYDGLSLAKLVPWGHSLDLLNNWPSLPLRFYPLYFLTRILRLIGYAAGTILHGEPKLRNESSRLNPMLLRKIFNDAKGLHRLDARAHIVDVFTKERVCLVRYPVFAGFRVPAVPISGETLRALMDSDDLTEQSILELKKFILRAKKT